MLAIVVDRLLAALAPAGSTNRLVSCASARLGVRSASLRCIAGWTTTEVGRQPWTIYGLMRTADSVSPSLTGHDVLLSLLLYVVVYLVMYPVGVLLMLRDGVRAGPAPSEEPHADRQRPAAGADRGARRRIGGERHAMTALRPGADLDGDPRGSACSSTWRSTASISASACSTTSRPTARRATW